MYGIHLNITPAVTGKRVVIHQRNCNFYKMMERRGRSRSAYSFNKNSRTMHDAMDRASEWSLEWHAPIKFCEKCFPIGQRIICSF